MESKNKKIARGKTLHKVAKRSTLKIGEIAEKAGYKYSTFFAHIKNDALPFEILAKYGKAMGHDFSDEFPEMADFITEDRQANYGKELSYDELLKDRNKWRDRFYEISDKYNKLGDKYNKLLEEKLGLDSGD